MPNPSGFNGVTPEEPPYGARKQMGAMQKSAPLAGQPISASAQNTPRRARRRAQMGAVEPAALPAPAPTASPAAAAVSFWQQVAQVPGVTPLVQELLG